MREFFQAFLMMSLQGAVLIAVLLVLRSVFCKRMAPGVLYALWLIPVSYTHLTLPTNSLV